jgi:aminomethyltransferase
MERFAFMLKKTALHETEKLLGAQFETRTAPGPDGSTSEWEVAVLYSSVDEEYPAVRRAAGLVDLSHRGKIEITGSDRVRFLNGQVTNDVKKLAVGRGCYACALDYQGALVADLKIYARAESLLIDASENCASKLFDHLNRFAISDEVEIVDRADDLSHLAIHGPQSSAVVLQACNRDLASLADFAHEEIQVAGHSVMAIRQSYTGELGFDLLVQSSDAIAVWNELLEQGRSLGLKCFGTETLKVLRLEAGIPEFGVDMTEEHLALEANLHSAISTDKGCYAGQEVVARIINRGHVNRILVGLQLSAGASLASGQKIFRGDQAVGEITSAAFSPASKKVIALGYVPSRESQPGAVFTVGEAADSVRAEIVTLPSSRKS